MTVLPDAAATRVESRLKIADDLSEKHGYPQLSAGIKDQILGLNPRLNNLTTKTYL